MEAHRSSQLKSEGNTPQQHQRLALDSTDASVGRHKEERLCSLKIAAESGDSEMQGLLNTSTSRKGPLPWRWLLAPTIISDRKIASFLTAVVLSLMAAGVAVVGFRALGAGDLWEPPVLSLPTQAVAETSAQPAFINDLLQAVRKTPTDNTGCHSFGEEAMDSRWFGWEMGLGYRHLNKSTALKCVNALPNKNVAFVGDSILRNVFQELLALMNAPQKEFDVINLALNPHHLNQNVVHKEGNATMRFIFTTQANSIERQLQRFPEAMSADVMFLDTGSWELGHFGEKNTLFMMSYISRLSAAIQFLQENFKGRLIFLMVPPSSHETVMKRTGWLRYAVQWNSKIQALNRFAEKVVQGAGFEVLNIYDFMFTGQGGFIPYEALTKDDGFHPNEENNKIALEIYLNEICHGRAFDSFTPRHIVQATKDFNDADCALPTGS